MFVKEQHDMKTAVKKMTKCHDCNQLHIAVIQMSSSFRIL